MKYKYLNNAGLKFLKNKGSLNESEAKEVFRDYSHMKKELKEFKEFKEEVVDEYEWMTRLLNAGNKREKRLEDEIIKLRAVVERYERTLTEEGYDVKPMIAEAELSIKDLLEDSGTNESAQGA